MDDSQLFFELKMSTRLRNVIALDYTDFVTVGTLRKLTDNEVKRIPGLGKRTFEELRNLIGPSTALTAKEG
jgi:DNA-directed RNA polymerase alpha subunit